VTVTLADGRTATHARESHRGDFSEPFSEAELRDKFGELAGTVLSAEGAAAAERAVDRIEEWDNVGELIGIFRRHGRS
jgi:hypothetical protein